MTTGDLRRKARGTGWFARDWRLYAMLLLPVAFYLIFCYKPMVGLIIAFQKFNMFKGMWGSKWIGLENFKFVMSMPDFPVALRNTLWLNFLGLIAGFPVPIVLATYPAAAGLEDSEAIFNLVFFAVLLSVLVQGSTLGALARRLRFPGRKRQGPPYSLELFTMAKSPMDLLVVELPGNEGDFHCRIRDLRLPGNAVITLVTRGDKAISPMGGTELRAGDYVTLLAPIGEFDEARKALLKP